MHVPVSQERGLSIKLDMVGYGRFDNVPTCEGRGAVVGRVDLPPAATFLAEGRGTCLKSS